MFLRRYVEKKKEQLKGLNRGPFLEPPGPQKRDFYGLFRERFPKEVKIIAEAKFSSPAKGRLTDLGLADILVRYRTGGADGISIITEENYFCGSKSYIEEARRLVELPILRKDFIVHPYEVYESRALGADCVLLIAEVLDRQELCDLVSASREVGIDCLLEVHTMQSLEAVLSLGLFGEGSGLILGINNRDLETLRVDLSSGEALLRHVPDEIPVIVESGIERREDIERFRRFGASGFLVGTALVRVGSPAEKLRELKGQCV
jgi:indole-3-glycerol phosphate synthase